MAEFKITRFRYTWKETWSGDSTLYLKDDVVFYEGSAWVCIRQHTPSIFDDDQNYIPPGDTLATPAWVKMTDGRSWKGNWSENILYEPENLVLAGGNLYLCLTTHTSSTNFNTDSIKWEIFAAGSNFRNTWLPGTRYKVNDVIRYNGFTYQCTFEHTTSSSLNESNFDVVVENYTYVGEYQSSTVYRKNDLVKYSSSVLKCITEHTGSTNIDDTKFEMYLPGFSFSNDWSNSTYYAAGDIVKKSGTLYVALLNNNNSEPGISLNYPTGNPNWTILENAINYKGNYVPGARYVKGDLVRRGGALWISLVDQLDDGSTESSIADGVWELVISGYNFKGSWRTNKIYELYDTVYYRGVVYYCNAPHLSSWEDFPGDNGNGVNYWNTIVVSNENTALNLLGDLITYNLYKNIIYDDSTILEFGDGSSYGHTPIPIGENDQLLAVENNNGDIYYKTWGTFNRIFFVRTDGIDIDLDNNGDLDLNRGKNYFKPFRTIKHALEIADDGYAGTTTILVSTGLYEEVLPLIVPKRVSIVGEELRGVTVKASDPISALANDGAHTLETLSRIGIIFPDILRGIPVDKSIGNYETQIITGSVSSAILLQVDNLWATIIDSLNYRLNGVGTLPSVTGSNNPIAVEIVTSVNELIENNRNFIKAEAIAFAQANDPLYSFNTDKCRRDIDKFIDAIKYDLQYTGNYKSTLAARYYANAVNGSALEDMWYVRDSTGLRNMTFTGLNGTLPDLVEGTEYSLPTGGAYVSLDPGWGPADEEVWITNRSCYVQNCTTFGYGAIGQKIDGALHNDGYKSIVSNDYTQIISDGVGAWVSNGGRAELVSVFTYYAHIGMFALNGGIIRATNGNSSYGDFGALADGLDDSEVIRYGYVNTRTEQAVVASAFAGEILDYIVALEYNNMGQNYTTATYSITSSGVGAVALQEEFRDNAMFECQVLSGGNGFSQYGNQAQLGDEFTITLAAAENVTESQIHGMRVIIISGEGTGQYGYVQAYNVGTKTITVYRESDNTPGWDHILPGTPSKTLLTTGTRYRIEPRPTFSEPAYSATEVTLENSYAISAGVYGETSETFTGLEGQLGTGTVVGDDGIVPIPAEFTVIKTGRNYSVTNTVSGAGYAVGDEITIDGADVGGISLEHDIVLTVTDVSDDSTNSIISFTVTGNAIADSGKFILTPTSGTTGLYSSNGSAWSEFTLPASGNWKCVASGNNRFVAIANSSSSAAYSTNGENWTSAAMPSSREWNGVVYGKPSSVSTGIFVAIAGNLNAGAYSTSGVSWNSTTLPTVGDSTLNEWVDITYGRNIFVALANSQNIVAVGSWNGTSLSWTGHVMDVIADSSQKDWVSIAYGNRRFVAIANTGEISYSFDGIDWLSGGHLPTQDGSTLHNWKQIRYGQGVFVAIGDTGARIVGDDLTEGPTTFVVTSYDGIVWSERTLATAKVWSVAVFGNPDVTLGDSTVSNSTPTWVVASSSSGNKLNTVNVGARALGRVVVSGTGISGIKLWEPGSGYNLDPVLTLTCSTKTEEAIVRPRLADKVLAQPVFTSKGVSYKTSTTSVTISGDGFADKTPNGKFLTLDGISRIPGPGAQLYIAGSSEYFVTVSNIETTELEDGTYRILFQVSPNISLYNYVEHGMEVAIREKYSQVRITGHDFLDVGTGNFVETNYPALYDEYEYTGVPYQEVYNLNGGRVFYTSTDQDGNFRAGKLFAVEQATGIITISADFFDLTGLTELRLAGVRVGSTAIVREFSKDSLFLQNSNSVIPTQRAVKSYLSSRLNIGGEDLLTPSITAGTVKIGPNSISNTAGVTIDIPVVADFYGSVGGIVNGISGSILAQTMFARSFNNRGR